MKVGLGRAAALVATLALGVGGAASFPPVVNAQRGGIAPCPATMPEGVSDLTCGCSARAVAADVTVWGVDIYSDDSGLCRAALHAGAVSREGGVATVSRRPGRASYQGVNSNGVVSQPYGRWPQSIVFEVADDTMAMATCPANAVAMRGQRRGITCECPSGPASGTVWGSGPYTDDSSVCAAARHAGLIDDSGGVIRLRPTAGRSSYRGTSAYGVSTSDYGSYPGSFALSAPN